MLQFDGLLKTLKKWDLWIFLGHLLYFSFTCVLLRSLNKGPITIMNIPLVHYLSVLSLIWSIYLASFYSKEWHWKWSVWKLVQWLLFNVQIVQITQVEPNEWHLESPSYKFTKGRIRGILYHLWFFFLQIGISPPNLTVRNHQLKSWYFIQKECFIAIQKKKQLLLETALGSTLEQYKAKEVKIIKSPMCSYSCQKT